MMVTTWLEGDAKDYPGGVADLTRKDGGANGDRKPMEVIVPVKSLEEAANGVRLGKAKRRPVLGNVVLEEPEPEPEKPPSDYVKPKVALVTTDLTNTRRTACEQVEGRFPKYEDAIPKYREMKAPKRSRPNPTATVIALDAAMLSEALKVMSDMMEGAELPAVMFRVPLDPHLPIEVIGRFEGMTMQYVQMPVSMERV